MPRKIRILVIEDEAAIRTGLLDVLVFHGYEVDSASDGIQGLASAREQSFDLILLDVMLPSMDGFEICRQIRAVDAEQPIIMLTAKSSDEDIIAGLSLGADDYVTKPFSVAQLVLRIQAVLRRARVSLDESHKIQLDATLVLDPKNLAGQRGSQSLAFTRREMDVIQYLYANTQRPVPREELLSKVWGYQQQMDIETRTVDIHIAKIRRKLEPDPSQPRYLVTIRGAGYRIVSP